MAYAHTGPLSTDHVETGAAAHGADWAYHLLHIGFVVAPLVAGIDKFFDVLTEWSKYLAPEIPRILNIAPEAFMRIVGVIEIVAAIVVAFKPKIGGYIVALWLLGIIGNLVINPVNWGSDATIRTWDIALRDLGLLFGALSLAWLASDRRVRQRE